MGSLCVFSLSTCLQNVLFLNRRKKNSYHRVKTMNLTKSVFVQGNNCLQSDFKIPASLA